MREFWKKTLFWAAVGFMLGMLVGLGISAIYDRQDAFTHGGAGRLNLFMSGLLGAVNTGSTSIYTLERWGLLRCTLTHFCLSMAATCTVGLSMGWFSLGDPLTLWMLAGWVVVYFIIWLVNYLIFKRQIRQINEALKRWKNAQGEGK